MENSVDTWFQQDKTLFRVFSLTYFLVFAILNNCDFGLLMVYGFMEKEHVISLTKQLYRLTLLFPKKEPLRYKMRQLADEVLADLLRITNICGYENTGLKADQIESQQVLYEQAGGRVEILQAYFAVASEQNWVKPTELLALWQDYDNMAEWLKSGLAEHKMRKDACAVLIPTKDVSREKRQKEQQEQGQNPAEQTQGIKQDRTDKNSRQKKILQVLRQKGKCQVWEVQKIFPRVTKRTLRRDFRYLLKKGQVQRKGERNQTFYQIGLDRT